MNEVTQLAKSDLEPSTVQWVDEQGELHVGLRIVKEVHSGSGNGEWWWKVMMSDLIGCLDEISGKQTAALKAILGLFDPHSGIVATSQKEIAEIAGCSVPTVNKVMKILQKRDLIRKKGPGVYVINPEFMSQGGRGRYDALMIQYKEAEPSHKPTQIIEGTVIEHRRAGDGK